jgi:hypothetical protein
VPKKSKIGNGEKDIFFSLDDGNNFGIAFDEIFGREELEIYNLFEMNSKRNFKNLVPSIIESYKEIFLDDRERFNEDLAIIMFNILKVKSDLEVQDGETTYEQFLEMIDLITDSNDNLLIKTIGDYVMKNYGLDLDEVTQETKDKKKKINEELQFSDSHARALIKIAYLFRIMIPVISVYFGYNKESFAKNEDQREDEDFEDLKFGEINSEIFNYLFEKFADNADAIRNKLYKLTLSRVSKTVYSDKRFWAAAKNQGITKDTETLEIYKKLLTNAIPKLSIDPDKNLISFFQAVIINQINFLFQNKFKNKFIILGDRNEKYSDDDDETSEYERLEIRMLRKDEGLYSIRKLNIISVLNKIATEDYFNVEVTDEEVKEAIKTFNRHETQEKLVSMLTYKYFEDKMAVKFLSAYQYTYLVLVVYKYLSEHKFSLLPQILMSKCEKHKERTTISGKRIRPMIQGSKKYIQLFELKYNNFSEEVEKPLSSIIASTYASVFTNVDGEEIFDSSVKVGKIADELIDLAYLM